MGRTSAPAYASILMSKFEKKCSILNPLIKNKSILFLQFIDDIFMQWIKSEQKLRNFRNLTNQKHQSIKFDLKFSKHKVKLVKPTKTQKSQI